MRHFDPHFKDLTDYIIKITAEIWEGRNVGAIRRYYHENAVRHTPYEDERGTEPIVQATLTVLDMFPDRRMLPQDVICDRQGEDHHSSHRIIATMHHTGNGLFGVATGKYVQIYAIADCAVRRNQIHEEWEVHDYKGLIVQLGLNPWTFVRENLLPALDRRRPTRSAAQPRVKAAEKQTTAHATTEGDPHVSGDREAAAHAVALLSIWEGQDLTVIRRIYHPACILHLPGAIVRYGHAAADAFFMSYLAAFNDIRLSIDRVTFNRDEDMPPRLALRWSVTGTHSGAGLFGPPTGVRVRFMGISHAHLHQGRIFSEWILIDELEIMAQLERRRKA